MASAQAIAPRLYYCHQCSHQWLKAQDSLFECPRCQEGFIEEVSDEFNPGVMVLPPAQSPYNYILHDAFPGPNIGENQRARLRARRGRGDNNRQGSSSRSRSPHIFINTHPMGGENRVQGISFYRNEQSLANRFLSVAIDDIMSFIFTPERQRVMSQEQLDAIPIGKITSEHVEAQLQCAICFEDFKLDENEVRKLPCNHFFHEKCIFPWLRNNASCPVCRTSLADPQPDSDEETASFIQFLTNNQRARQQNQRRTARANNDDGPSTSAAHSDSDRSETPPRRVFATYRYRGLQPPTRNREAPNRTRGLNSPVSSRTRSRSRIESPPTGPEPRNNRSRVASNSVHIHPYLPQARSSRIPTRSTNAASNINNNNNVQPQPSRPNIRRRRMYSSPTSRIPVAQANRFDRQMDEFFLELANIMDSDSSDSSMSPPLVPSPIPLDLSE